MALFPDPILILLQAIPFLVCIWVLNALIYKPMLAYLLDRERATVGSREDALRLQQDAELKLAEYQERLAAARSETAALLAAARARAQAERERRLEAARAEAEQRIGRAVQLIAGEKELAARELERHAEALADQIASRVLGRDAA